MGSRDLIHAADVSNMRGGKETSTEFHNFNSYVTRIR